MFHAPKRHGDNDRNMSGCHFFISLLTHYSLFDDTRLQAKECCAVMFIGQMTAAQSVTDAGGEREREREDL